MFVRASMAIAMATALGGSAVAYERGQEILSSLPADAPPGECYARVRVPGGPTQAPPQMQGAQWVLNPGPPGSPGPIWCLVPTGPAPVAFEPDRYGFIRVLCDDDLTRDRVTRMQRKLHERGHYRGSVHGRYDSATADAVRSFQSSANIAHGGYLSTDTVEALEGGYGPSQYAGSGYGQGYQQPSYAQPSYAPPVQGPPAYSQAGYGAHDYSQSSGQSYGQAYGGGYQTSASYAGGSYTPWHGSPCLTPCVMPPAPPPPPPPPPLPCIQCVPVPPPLPCNPCTGIGYGYPQAYGQGYSYSYATPGYAHGIGYGLGGGVGYGAGGGYSHSWRLPMPAYAAAGYANGGYGGAYYSSSGYSSSHTAISGGRQVWPVR